MQIAGILARVTTGNITLPAFQRGYVWKRRQVRELFDSLYRRFPVGSLLTWITSLERGGTTELVLDGHQRVTSLYGVIKGEAPDFFDGDDKSFSNLYFHAGEERFEFFQSTKMKEDPLWFDVTRVMKGGVSGLAGLLAEKLGAPGEKLDPIDFITINNRLLHLLGVTGIDLHIEQITDEGHSDDTVLDIFNRLNSSGWSCPAMTDTFRFGSTEEVSHGGKKTRAVFARVQGTDGRACEGWTYPGVFSPGVRAV